MTTILNPTDMTEEDVKLQFITPALTAKWDVTKITMETPITDGRVNIQGNHPVREKPKKVDYLLHIRKNYPIAVVEAKDCNHTVSYGMQQAITYATMLDIPFAYSSNGVAFQEHDLITGKEQMIPLNAFPTEQELMDRYRLEKGLTPEEERVIDQPYYTSGETFAPRYYQRIAINRTLDAIARDQKRILLVMATGTGKTYTAFQIVHRYIKSHQGAKVLYLVDRNALADQSIDQDFAPLKQVTHKVNYAVDVNKKAELTAYQLYFCLYQQLVGDNEEEHFRDLFAPDYFDLIIVDECHRGSAKADSTWRKILEYFESATQIGMTATPKETAYVSNLSYFGEPVYKYSLKQGIDDGFLAPFRVINDTLDIADGWRPTKGQLDMYGNPIEDRIYANSDYDYNIVLLDRTRAVAEDITKYLKATDRYQRTIVFCATEEAAERMRVELNNLNSDLTKDHPDYVVRITGSDEYGRGKIKEFISDNTTYPVIATTSKLLSTGVDVKLTRLIVLDEWITSMTEFKQIIGRGTRIREKKGKLSFVIMDFRNITRLFADPDWDGPITVDPGFPGGPVIVDPPVDPGDPGDPPGPVDPPGMRIIPIVDADGCTVKIINRVVSVYDTNGKLLKQESITDYTKSSILGKYATLDNFINKWDSEDRKEAISEELLARGIDLSQMKKEENMEDVDDFDFICHVAYDAKPLTRAERAKNVQKRDFLHKWQGEARDVLDALLQKYMDNGIYDLEKMSILKLKPFDRIGNPAKIVKLFGGKSQYQSVVKELEKEIYSSEEPRA
ncbi:MAG: DEAD/DEAH box helicase family protein [Lactimicrobium massiliense]|nr:DEAD/DEAH box helicase family protein [Lactimicrobium massiliense]MDD6727592.1 DEAD/DEAH box helicase family protein [Lactimicrobium massiliense]